MGRQSVSISLTVASLAPFAALGIARYGSISAALADARGERLVIDEPPQSFGQRPVGSAFGLHYAPRNVTSRPITIRGGANLL